MANTDNTAESVATDWMVQKVVDADTGHFFHQWQFPTEGGGIGKHRTSFKLKQKLGLLADELLEFGAKFPNGDQGKFLCEILGADAATNHAALLIRTSGYRGKGFVFPNGEPVGDVPPLIWDTDATPDLPIGIVRGNTAEWNESYAQHCVRSNPLAFAVMVALTGACLPYASLPETAVFNFAGESSSGKTTLARVVASVFGSPFPFPSWNNTPRALEELCALYNGFCVILNDTEAFPDNPKELRKALKGVAQTLPEGQSKARSKAVSGPGKQLTHLKWSCFGISTSIKTAEDLSREAGSQRSEGEQVRLIDVPVPTREEGGIFDELSDDGGPATQQSRLLIDQIEAALPLQHGSLIRPWVQYILSVEHRLPKEFQKHVEIFVNRVTPAGTGFEIRLARKFAVPYVAGRLAIAAGLLDWPRDLPYRAAEACYQAALKAIRSESQRTAAALAQLHVAATDIKLMPEVVNGARISPAKWDAVLGVRTQVRGEEVVALRSDRLHRLSADHIVQSRLLVHLRQNGVLLPGHGGKRTQQPITLRIDGEARRPRFLVLDATRLRELTSTDA